jgi:elongation of very long chain fatty acids protein 6
MSVIKEFIYDYLNQSKSSIDSIVYSRARTDVWINDPFYRDFFPWASVIVYYILLQIIPKFVKKPAPFIKPVMAAWNGFLALLSIAMFVGVFDRFVRRYLEVGLFETLCGDYLTKQPDVVMYWCYMFAKSKYIELFDTLWMLLNKKPVPFLHWWHHITVLLFTWYAMYWSFSVGIVFIFVNALVHSFMYTCLFFNIFKT